MKPILGSPALDAVLFVLLEGTWTIYVFFDCSDFLEFSFGPVEWRNHHTSTTEPPIFDPFYRRYCGLSVHVGIVEFSCHSFHVPAKHR